MKKSCFSTAMVGALACAFIMNSCADNDVYDPGKEKPIAPVENPLGSDFKAPDGFDWFMTSTVDLSVAVKDEFLGQYHYLIEVFTTNPLTNSSASPIAAGLAKSGKNYTEKITIPQTCERIFIRQTDPKQRKEVYEYAVPEKGGTLSCKLYFENTATRAVGSSTSAFEAAQAAGIKELEDKDYKEEDFFSDIPTSSSEVQEGDGGSLTFAANAKFIISEEYTDSNPFTTSLPNPSSGRASIYVKGTWKTDGLTWQNLDVYVVDGGKIISNNDVTFNSNSRLFIASGGQISFSKGLEMGSSETKNFGTIAAKSISVNRDKTELFNAGTITTKGEFRINQTNFINHGTVDVGGLFKMNSDNKVTNSGNITTVDLNLTSSVIGNYKEITFSQEATTNNSNEAAIINHSGATLKGPHWAGGMSLYNDGFAEFNICENGSVDLLYNSCTMIIKEKFLFANVILDKGSITGGKPDNLNAGEGDNAGLWKPVPLIGNNRSGGSSGSPIKFIMKNGSMIKATRFEVTSTPNAITGEGDAASPSLFQLKEVYINSGGDTRLSGNLVVEVPKDAFTYGSGIDGVNRGKWITTGTSNVAGWQESKYTFETCGGYYSPGNAGNPDASEPEFPIEIGNGAVYTFAFEDQWPIYGDFDMNDVVVTIDNISSDLNSENSTTYMEGIKIKGHIHAVGASKKLGVAIHFPNLPTQITGVSGTLKGENAEWSIEDASDPSIVLTNDIHLLMGNNVDDRSFINTKSLNKPSVEFEINLATGHINTANNQFNINKVDLFIFKDVLQDGRRTEIHLPGFAPTKLGNTAQFGNGNDASSTASNKYYVSTDNLAWGICIPGNTAWAWPKETVSIEKCYPDFKGWVTTGGKKNTGWMQTNNGNVIAQ